jgi:DUF2407 C-terminal domain
MNRSFTALLQEDNPTHDMMKNGAIHSVAPKEVEEANASLLTLRVQPTNVTATTDRIKSNPFLVQCYPYQTTVGDLKQWVLESMIPSSTSGEETHTPSSYPCMTLVEPRMGSLVSDNDQQTPMEEEIDRYNVRLIAFGQLLLPDDVTLDAFPQVLKLWRMSRPETDETAALESTAGVIHAVVTKVPPASISNREETTPPSSSQTDLLPFSMALQSSGGEDDDLLFYPDDENFNAYFEEEDDDGILEDNDEDPDAIPMDLELGGDGGLLYPPGLYQSRPLPAALSHRRASRRRRRSRPTEPRIPLGFDRLRVTGGLCREDIVILRLYFNPAIDQWLQSNAAALNIGPTHDTLRQRRIQEDLWMNAQSPLSEFRLNLNVPMATTNQSPLLALPLPPVNDENAPSGIQGVPNFRNRVGHRVSTNNIGSGAATMIGRSGILPSSGSTPLPSSSMWSMGSDREFVYGFLLGSTVGSWMLLWVWIPTVSYKQKLGILVGYSFHLTMLVLQKSMFPHLQPSAKEHVSEEDYYSYSKNFLINDDTLQLGE